MVRGDGTSVKFSAGMSGTSWLINNGGNLARVVRCPHLSFPIAAVGA